MKHYSDRGNSDHSPACICKVFIIFAESAVPIQPCGSSSDNPSTDCSAAIFSPTQWLTFYFSNPLLLPKKKSEKNPLSGKDKRNNKKLSRQRVFAEHVIGKIRILRILSDRYRYRREISELRFRLIAGIYNFELKSGGNDF